MNLKPHLLMSVISITSLVFILRLVRRRQLRAKYSLLWLPLGAALVILGVAPGLLDWAAGEVGIYYAPAMLFLAGIMFLLLVAVHLSWEVSRLEERTRILAEELALLRAERDAPPVPPVGDPHPAPGPPASGPAPPHWRSALKAEP